MPKKKSKPIPMKVFHLSMECYPVAKVGGLAPRCRAIASRGPGIANHRNLTPATARNEIRRSQSFRVVFLFPQIQQRPTTTPQRSRRHHAVPFQHALVFNISRGDFLLFQADSFCFCLRSDHQRCRISFG